MRTGVPDGVPEFRSLVIVRRFKMPENFRSHGAPENKSRVVHRTGGNRFFGIRKFLGSQVNDHVLRATKIYSHNFCYQERTVNIDVYVSVDTGSFSVAIILSYY